MLILKKMAFSPTSIVFIVKAARQKGGRKDGMNQETLKEFYEKYADLVYRLCMLYLKNESDAKDGVQEVFLRLWEKQPDLRNEEHTKAWLILVTKRYCMDVLKSGWRKKRVEMDSVEEQAAEDSGEGGELLEYVLKLPEKFLEVIYLYYYEDYSVKEIGQMLKKSQSTVSSRLVAGRKKLQKMLEQKHGSIDLQKFYGFREE